jgi:hypothetical protein
MALKKNAHENIRENLSAYLDKRLDAPTAAAVEAHLASCAECAWEKNTLEQTCRLVAQAPRVAPPRSFVLREAQVSAPVKASFFSSARMVYLRGATAVAGVLLAVVVAGDVWVRPAVTPMAAPADTAQTEMLTFAAATEAQPTAIEGVKLAAQDPDETPQPEATSPPPQAMPAPDDGTRGLGAGPEATSDIAAQEYGVNDLGAGTASAPFWVDIRMWRVAEGMLGAMFVALVAITATGWRRIARLG